MNETKAGTLAVFITAADDDEAGRIAGRLLSERLAACVNILGPVRSRYWWEDKIEEAGETLLIAKTVPSRLDALIEAVREVHSYEVPEIIALPIAGGGADYLKWVADEVEPR